MSIIYNVIKGVSKLTSSYKLIRPNIYLLDFTIANAFIIFDESHNWILVDTGLENSMKFIEEVADKHFEVKPKAIILTHGHFDHIGCIKQLVKKWDIPVYAHQQEFPYLTGKKDYPKPDPTVDGGLVSKLSPSFPHSSINISKYLYTLPENNSVPYLEDWEWIHTPGHTEGHISLYNNKDKTLIVGDAFTTLKQESFTSVATKKEEISGPPAYLTTNWEDAYNSIVKLKNLEPYLALPSHGEAMVGDSLSKHLDYLIFNFEDKMPKEGRFVERP